MPMPNPAGYSPQGASATLGSMNAPLVAQQDQQMQEKEAADSQQQTTTMFLEQFRDAWKKLEDLNSKFSGDDDSFRTLQKAAESWLSSIASKLPDSSQQSSQAQPPQSNY